MSGDGTVPFRLFLLRRGRRRPDEGWTLFVFGERRRTARWRARPPPPTRPRRDHPTRTSDATPSAPRTRAPRSPPAPRPRGSSSRRSSRRSLVYRTRTRREPILRSRARQRRVRRRATRRAPRTDPGADRIAQTTPLETSASCQLPPNPRASSSSSFARDAPARQPLAQPRALARRGRGREPASPARLRVHRHRLARAPRRLHRQLGVVQPRVANQRRRRGTTPGTRRASRARPPRGDPRAPSRSRRRAPATRRTRRRRLARRRFRRRRLNTRGSGHRAQRRRRRVRPGLHRALVRDERERFPVRREPRPQRRARPRRQKNRRRG